VPVFPKNNREYHTQGGRVGMVHLLHTQGGRVGMVHLLYTPREAWWWSIPTIHTQGGMVVGIYPITPREAWG